MKIRDALTWFKTNFGPKLEPAVAGTPFNIDMLSAIAYQESGEVWPVLVDKQLGIPKILELCVGDTLDGRSATSSAPTIYFVGWVISGRALVGGKPER